METKQVKYWKALIVLILAVFAVFRVPFWEDNVFGGFEVCIGYLTEGSLYGGQPFCSQAPLIFYWGLLIKAVFGMGHLWLGLALTKILLYAAVLYLTNELVKALGYGSGFLTAVLFLLFIYPNGSNKPEALFCAAFFLAGFHTQYLRKPRHMELIAGCFYAVALFFKYSAIYPILLSLVICIYGSWKNNRLSAVLGAANMTLPAAALTLLLYMLHPLFLEYTVISQVMEPRAGFFEGLYLQFLSWDVHCMALSVLAALYAYLFFMGGFSGYERLFFLYPLTILPVSFSMTQGWAEFRIPEYYALPLYPLLLVSTQTLLKKKTIVFAFVVGALLLYPSFDGKGLLSSERDKYLAAETEGLNDLVMSGLGALPPSQKGLLFESDAGDIGYIERYGAEKFFNRFGWKVLGKDNRFIPPLTYGPVEDPFWAPKLRKRIDLAVEYPSVDGNASAEKVEIRKEILQGRYDVMMYTATSWLTLTEILSKIPEDRVKELCELSVPDYTLKGHGRNYNVVIYTNKTVCKEAAKKMAEHYLKNFDMICEKSAKAMWVIRNINYKNGLLIKRECDKNTWITYDYESSPRPMDVVITLLILAVTYRLSQATNQKSKKTAKKVRTRHST